MLGRSKPPRNTGLSAKPSWARISSTVRGSAEPAGKGIWWLAGSGNHRSVVFEFENHLTLFEAPPNQARSKAGIDKARTLSSKPLTQVVVPEEQQIQRRFHFSHFMSALLTYFSEASKFGADTMRL